MKDIPAVTADDRRCPGCDEWRLRAYAAEAEVERRREKYPYSELDMDMHVEAVTKDLRTEIERLKAAHSALQRRAPTEAEIWAAYKYLQVRSSTAPEWQTVKGALEAASQVAEQRQD